jgi:hypothetical protein
MRGRVLSDTITANLAAAVEPVGADLDQSVVYWVDEADDLRILVASDIMLLA